MEPLNSIPEEEERPEADQSAGEVQKGEVNEYHCYHSYY
jgi:hypothetical protein